MGVKRWNGSAYTDLNIPKVNNVAPVAAYAWVSGAYVQLWPELFHFDDNFNDRNAQYLDASANWVQYSPNMTYRGYIGGSGQAANMVGVFHNTTDSTTTSYGRWVSPLNTNNQAVQGTIGNGVNNTHYAYLILNGSSTFGTWVGLRWIDSSIRICSATGGGTSPTITDRATVSNTQSVGQVLRLEKIGNVYTGYVNGSTISGLQWTDSGAIVPDNKYGGLGVTRRRAAFVNSQSSNIDNWSFEDIQAA